MSSIIRILLGVAVAIIVISIMLIAPGMIFLWGLTNDVGALSKAELIQNYRTRQPQLQQLKMYFNSVVPPGYQVYIEYDQEDKIDFRVYKKIGPDEQDLAVVFNHWSINPYAYVPNDTAPSPDPADSLETRDLTQVKRQLGWTDATFREIKRRLDAAHCISIKSGEPTQIGFARSDMGKYMYDLFSQPLPDSLLHSTRWNGCNREPLNPTVVLRFGGGAIGPDCFPDPK